MAMVISIIVYGCLWLMVSNFGTVSAFWAVCWGVPVALRKASERLRDPRPEKPGSRGRLSGFRLFETLPIEHGAVRCVPVLPVDNFRLAWFYRRFLRQRKQFKL